MNTLRNLLGLLILLSAAQAEADTLRCANQLVSLGDRTFDVQRKCGTPVYHGFVGYGQGVVGDTHDFAPAEEWIYQPEGNMQQVLTFEGSRLVRIESRRAP